MVSNDTVALMARLALDDFLPYRLVFTANGVSEVVARAYKALFDLTIPEWRVIAHAAERDSVTQAEIVGRSGMDKVTVSRAAIALVGRGLLDRRDHPGDRRSHRLVLSEAGAALYEQVAPKALELERAIFAGFGREERAALVAMLRRIDEAVARL
jgi:DNA-binding MarR family transcriptional regulator